MKKIKKINHWIFNFHFFLIMIMLNLSCSEGNHEEVSGNISGTGFPETLLSNNFDSNSHIIPRAKNFYEILDTAFQLIADIPIQDVNHEKEIFLVANNLSHNESNAAMMLDGNVLESYKKLKEDLSQWLENKLNQKKKESQEKREKETQVQEWDTKDISFKDNISLLHDFILYHAWIEKGILEEKKIEDILKNDIKKENPSIGFFIRCCSPSVKIYLINSLEKILDKNQMKMIFTVEKEDCNDAHWKEYLGYKGDGKEIKTIISEINKDDCYNVLLENEEEKKKIKEESECFELLEEVGIDIELGMLDDSNKINVEDLQRGVIKLSNPYLQAFYDFENGRCLNLEIIQSLHKESVSKMMKQLMREKYNELRKLEECLGKLSQMCFDEYSQLKAALFQKPTDNKQRWASFFKNISHHFDENKARCRYGERIYKIIYQKDKEKELKQDQTLAIQIEEENIIKIDHAKYKGFMEGEDYFVFYEQWKHDIKEYQTKVQKSKDQLDEKYNQRIEERKKKVELAQGACEAEKNQETTFYKTNDIIHWYDLNKVITLLDFMNGKTSEYSSTLQFLDILKEEENFQSYFEKSILINEAAKDKTIAIINELYKDNDMKKLGLISIFDVIQKVVLNVLKDSGSMEIPEWVNKNYHYFRILLFHVLSKSKAKVGDDFLKAIFSLFSNQSRSVQKICQQLQAENLCEDQSQMHPILFMITKQKNKGNFSDDDFDFIFEHRNKPIVQEYIRQYMFTESFYEKSLKQYFAKEGKEKSLKEGKEKSLLDYQILLYNQIINYINGRVAENSCNIHECVRLLYKISKDQLEIILNNIIVFLKKEKVFNRDKNQPLVKFLEECYKSIEEDRNIKMEFVRLLINEKIREEEYYTNKMALSEDFPNKLNLLLLDAWALLEEVKELERLDVKDYCRSFLKKNYLQVKETWFQKDDYSKMKSWLIIEFESSLLNSGVAKTENIFIDVFKEYNPEEKIYHDKIFSIILSLPNIKQDPLLSEYRTYLEQSQLSCKDIFLKNIENIKKSPERSFSELNDLSIERNRVSEREKNEVELTLQEKEQIEKDVNRILSELEPYSYMSPIIGTIGTGVPLSFLIFFGLEHKWIGIGFLGVVFVCSVGDLIRRKIHNHNLEKEQIMPLTEQVFGEDNEENKEENNFFLYLKSQKRNNPLLEFFKKLQVIKQNNNKKIIFQNKHKCFYKKYFGACEKNDNKILFLLQKHIDVLGKDDVSKNFAQPLS